MPDDQTAAARPLGEILQRIDERLRQIKLSERAITRKAGLSPAQIRTMRRQYAERRQHNASDRTIRALAEALDVRLEWLKSGIGPRDLGPSDSGPSQSQPDRSGKSVRVAGAIAAGVWHDGAVDTDMAGLTPVPPDPRYPADCQSAYEVRGTSVDQVARPGDFLIVLDRDKMGLPPRSGDLVVVTSSKNGLKELTARRYRVDAIADVKLPKLHFESNDPRYSEVLVVPDIADSGSVKIGGVVVAVYRPLFSNSLF